ncbi:MAG: flagellin lysine-N-methylase [Thiohalomonadales bacterium]
MEKFGLKLLDEFQCLAGDCPNNCCHDWDIEVDETTLKKWNKLTEVQNSALQESVEAPANDNNRKAILKKRSNGNCVHLAENAECQIHRDHGHEFLSVACREYPRFSLAKDDREVVSARLSCPQVINLLLQESNTTMFEFVHSELSEPSEPADSGETIAKPLQLA